MLTDEIPYKIYPLENSSPKHLAEVLQSLIQETVEQQKEGGKIEKVVVNKDEKIKIVPDPNTYSLIVYANKKNQEWIANLITQLDKRRPQVLIDVTLVEITKTRQVRLRSEPDAQLARSAPARPASRASTTTDEDCSAKARCRPADGGLTAFYGDKQVQALLDTVQEKNYGRVLAKPKLLVNDNEQGKHRDQGHHLCRRRPPRCRSPPASAGTTSGPRADVHELPAATTPASRWTSRRTSAKATCSAWTSS